MAGYLGESKSTPASYKDAESKDSKGECVFPFKYYAAGGAGGEGAVSYTTCTHVNTEGVNGVTARWCATRVDGNGVYENSGIYAECPSNFPDSCESLQYVGETFNLAAEYKAKIGCTC